MNDLKAGFASVNVTPMTGIEIRGYFVERISEGVLDDLELRALALEAGGRRAVLMSMDVCGIHNPEADSFRAAIMEATGLPEDAIFLSATHTHTGPELRAASDKPIDQEYFRFVRRRMADCARYALEDLRPARMGWAVGQAPHVAFMRRYRMKDGSIRTNPGVGNPDIEAPIGEVDERVNVLRFERPGAETLVLVNFGNHPDTIGGCRISADWPGFLRRSLEKAIDGTRCIFFNGAQGDVNHVNVNAKDGDLNDMFMDFDDVSRGYGHARHVGRVVAGAVMQVYDKVNYLDVDSLHFLQRVIRVPSNMPEPGQMEQARLYDRLHNEGRDSEIPFKGMALTTVVAEAERMVRLEHGPEWFEMRMSAVSIGPVAFVGIPGEPFTGIGRALKQTPGWTLVLPCCLTNGAEGYFPMEEAYIEGGYEARSSPFRQGVAEQLIEEGQKLLAAL